MVSTSGARNGSFGALRLALDAKRPQIQEGVLLWAANNLARYPWRQDGKTPYEVFLGELLLGETSPEKAARAHELMLQSFPSFQALAQASTLDLATALASLDLDGHASALKSTVECASRDGKGQLPLDSEFFLNTCGFETHAVRAIMCFGYNLPVAVVDGNAARMLSNLFYDTLPPQPSEGFLQALAETLLPERNPQRYNGAFLDMAKQFCKSDPPLCGHCPLVGACDYATHLSRTDTLVSA